MVKWLRAVPVDILMEFGSLSPPPWVLDSRQEVDFLVSYIPDDTGLDDSVITVRGSDPQTSEIEVIQFGEGVFEQ